MAQMQRSEPAGACMVGHAGKGIVGTGTMARGGHTRRAYVEKGRESAGERTEIGVRAPGFQDGVLRALVGAGAPARGLRSARL